MWPEATPGADGSGDRSAMSTPLGHMLAGSAAAVTAGSRTPTLRVLAVGALAGGAPDLDFLPGLILGDPARFHHGPSHSLLFAVLVAGLAWLLASRHRGAWALAAGAAYASHLLLDALTVDPSPPVGIQLLWPVSDAYVASPFRPLPRVLHTAVNVINLHNFGVAVMELALFGGLLWACLRLSPKTDAAP